MTEARAKLISGWSGPAGGAHANLDRFSYSGSFRTRCRGLAGREIQCGGAALQGSRYEQGNLRNQRARRPANGNPGLDRKGKGFGDRASELADRELQGGQMRPLGRPLRMRGARRAVYHQAEDAEVTQAQAAQGAG